MKTMILVSFFATVALAAPEARFIEIAVGQKFQKVENEKKLIFGDNFFNIGQKSFFKKASVDESDLSQLLLFYVL